MKINFTRWISGILFIVLGLLIAIGPQLFFQPCDGTLQICVNGEPSDKFVPMKCHWSAMAEVGVGGAIALLGVLLLCFRRAQIRFGISLAQVPLGIAAILLPTQLIGVCSNPQMKCNELMFPMLIVLGSLVIALSLANAFLLFKKGDIFNVEKTSNNT